MCRIRNYSSGFGWRYLALTRHLNTAEFYNGNPISISQYENRKKAANIVCARLSGKPKDYGIMALLVPRKPTLRDLFRFLLVSRLAPYRFTAFFFPVFLLGK